MARQVSDSENRHNVVIQVWAASSIYLGQG